jgi:hypothetical protein
MQEIHTLPILLPVVYGSCPLRNDLAFPESIEFPLQGITLPLLGLIHNMSIGHTRHCHGWCDWLCIPLGKPVIRRG